MKVLSTTWDTITPSIKKAILKLFLDQKLQVWAILGPLHTQNNGHYFEGSWPLHFKISHWSKRPKPFNLISHSKVKAYGSKEIIMDEKSIWIMFHDLLKFTLGPLSKGSFDRNSNRPCRVNKWLRVKGPYNYMVTALGPIVKWPSLTPYGFSLFQRVPFVCRLYVLESKVTHVYMVWGFLNVWI